MAEGGPEDVRDIQSLREELEKIQKEIEHARKQKDTKERLRREIEKAKQELADLKGDKEDSMRDEVAGKTVAFTAVVSPASITNLGTGQPIVFDKIITNLSSAYDNNTGIFTAPCSGVFIFEMALMVSADTWQYLEFVKDGESIMFNYGHTLGTTVYESSTRRSVVLEVKKGSKVWIRVGANGEPPNGGSGKLHGNGFTTFSGWLLK